MNPLDTSVGVHRISLSLSRTVMLPSLAAANPRAYSRRPISHICSLILYSFIETLHCREGARPCEPRLNVQHHLIQQTGAVGVHGLLLGVERHRRLAALAEADARPQAGAQLVEDHQVLAVGGLVPQPLEAERHADHPALGLQRGVDA